MEHNERTLEQRVADLEESVGELAIAIKQLSAGVMIHTITLNAMAGVPPMAAEAKAQALEVIRGGLPPGPELTQIEEAIRG